MRKVRQIVLLLACTLCNTVAPALDQESSTDTLDPAFATFVEKMERDKYRFLLREEARYANNSLVEAKRLQDAIENSEAWINAVLKREFVLDDLKTRIEGIVGCYLGSYHATPGKEVPYDCTRVEFESHGYQFLIMQDSRAISFLIAPVKFDYAAKADSPDVLAKKLQEKIRKFFQCAEASLYLKAIRVTDFGVELIDPHQVWYYKEEKWKATVVVPCPFWEEGLLGRPNRNSEGVVIPDEVRRAALDEVMDRLLVLDPTLPREQRAGFESIWWGRAFAATDGRVLAYSAPKMSAGGQAVLPPSTPDWFRKSESENLDDGSLNKAGLPRERGANWPQ